jgi:hypothetical protein
MSIRVPALALGGLLACSGPAAPPPADVPPPPTAEIPDSKTVAADGQTDDRPMSLMPPVNVPAPKKEPPLTQEEIDLIAADPKTLSPEMRRARAFAVRRKILQNPDSPAARQLEALRLAYERGELQKQLPDKTRTRDGGITLNARNPGPAPTSEPKPEPVKSETPSSPPAPAPSPAP